MEGGYSRQNVIARNFLALTTWKCSSDSLKIASPSVTSRLPRDHPTFSQFRGPGRVASDILRVARTNRGPGKRQLNQARTPWRPCPFSSGREQHEPEQT